MWPEKFQNKTNGVTPRRWIRFCNQELSKILTKWLGTEDWVLQTERLTELRKVKCISYCYASSMHPIRIEVPYLDFVTDYWLFLQFADSRDLHKEWRAAKRANKIKLVSYIKEKTGYAINPDAMFDIQVGTFSKSRSALVQEPTMNGRHNFSIVHKHDLECFWM
jgi:glycogen phosphorylase